MTRLQPNGWIGMLTGLVVACGCGSSGLRTVPTGEHPPDRTNLVPVGFPPPPAKVEETGTSPRADCAWQDGHWNWIGRNWEWVGGAWVVPPSGCYYAHEVIMVWVSSDSGGVLYYGKPRWYRQGAKTQSSKASCPQPVACESPPAS